MFNLPLATFVNTSISEHLSIKKYFKNDFTQSLYSLLPHAI